MEYEHEHEPSSPGSPSFKSSPSSWIRSKTADLPEDIKDKVSNFFSKIVAGRSKSSRRPINTSEFRYDPESYALNFEDESARIDDHEFPALWSYSARLPQPANVVSSQMTTACN